jgi:hypothetical protein
VGVDVWGLLFHDKTLLDQAKGKGRKAKGDCVKVQVFSPFIFRLSPKKIIPSGN